MSTLLSLVCPSCGAKLKVTEYSDRATCAFCGNEYVTDHTGTAVALTAGPEPAKSVPELAMERVRSELASLENALDSIGMPDSIAKVFVATTRVFSFDALAAGLFFYEAAELYWPFGSLDWLGKSGRIGASIMLAIFGLGIMLSIPDALKAGFSLLEISRDERQKRKQILDRIPASLAELERYREAYFSSLSRGRSKAVASEMAISRLKGEVSSIQEKLMELGMPASVILILIGTVLGFAFLGLLSAISILLALGKEVPPIPQQALSNLGLSIYVRIILGIISAAAGYGAHKVLETGAHRMATSRFITQEQERLQERLRFETAELEKHQRAVSELLGTKP